MTVKKTYRAIYRVDDNGWWFVRAPEVPGAHTQGRTIAAARANIRQAVALVLEVDEDSFELEDCFELDDDLSRLIDRANAARVQYEAIQRELHEAVEGFVRLVRDRLGNRVGVRDISEMAGVSFQRVQQVEARLHRAPRHRQLA